MHSSVRTTVIALGIGLLTGCNAFEEPPESRLEPGDRVRVVPLDTREPVTAEQPPPPTIGGTLAVAPDGRTAVVADPARDRVSIVGLAPLSISQQVELDEGDEPGRVAVDASGRAHVVLRGGGALATLDLGTGRVVSRREVCPAPRGLAHDDEAGVVHVACMGGELVTLPEGSGEPLRRLHVEPDLRDVVLDDADTVWVTRFKSAQMLRVDLESGTVMDRLTPPAVDDASSHDETTRPGRKEPAVAWRAVPLPSSPGALMVHQRALATEIDVDETDAEPNDVPSSPYGGAVSGRQATCDGIVQTTVSRMHGLGMEGAPALSGVRLPVDVAASDDERTVAIAEAGLRDPEAPRVTFRTVGGSDPRMGVATPAFHGNVHLIRREDQNGATDECVSNVRTLQVGDGSPSTAVAFVPGRPRTLLVQLRQPATLAMISDIFNGDSETLELGGEPVADTGHALFHRDSGGGIACANCHPEGGEDGRVWRFAGMGPRRTQALNVGLEGTAPFHWDGTLPDLSSLMNEVFVGRMGGVRQSDARIETLSRWMFSLQPPPPTRTEDDPAVARGEEIFHDPAVGCADCHAGAAATDNRTVDVDTTDDGTALQVPSLVGIGHRAPFMHDGCAETLRERFDPECGGGDAHGRTSHLDEGEIADLIAYLESL